MNQLIDEAERILFALRQDGLPSGKYADLARAIVGAKAAQQSVQPTVLPVREIEVICPNCNLVHDVPVSESHSG